MYFFRYYYMPVAGLIKFKACTVLKKVSEQFLGSEWSLLPKLCDAALQINIMTLKDTYKILIF